MIKLESKLNLRKLIALARSGFAWRIWYMYHQRASWWLICVSGRDGGGFVYILPYNSESSWGASCFNGDVLF